MSTPTEIGFSLGTNEGDRLAHLRAAAAAIGHIPGMEVLARSAVYETEPVGVPPEFAGQLYLNAVLIGRHAGSVAAIAAAIAEIEKNAGRVRTAERNAPRPIDIDVIYVGARVLESPLQIPHPRWASRRFVAQPLCDVRPDLVLPGQNRTVREVLLSLPPAPGVVLLTREW